MLSISNKTKGYAVDSFFACNIMWEDIPATITRHVWGNTIWAGRYRKEKFFLGSTYCVLDIDDGLTKTEAREKLDGYKYMLGSTKSDGIEKVSESGNVKPAMDRFRIIVPWQTPIIRLDVYKFNMIKLITEFSGDLQTSDGARAWQPCKKIETLTTHGKLMPVIEDLPEKDTEAYKIKHLTKARNAMRRGTPLSHKVQDFLQGHVKEGFINNTLFIASCELFNRGFTISEVREITARVRGISTRSDYSSTILSAARSTGAM